MAGKEYIVLSGKAPIPLSKVTVDCDLDLCVPTRKGETLKTVLKRMCERLEKMKVSPSVDWTNVLNKPEFFSGDYNDLINKPDLAGVNGTSVYNKELIGIKNGVNANFTVEEPFQLTTTRVYLNGVRMKLGWDYEETSTNSITFEFPISSEDQLIIDYNI